MRYPLEVRSTHLVRATHLSATASVKLNGRYPLGARYPLGRSATHIAIKPTNFCFAHSFDSNRFQQRANRFLSLLSRFLSCLWWIWFWERGHVWRRIYKPYIHMQNNSSRVFGNIWTVLWKVWKLLNAKFAHTLARYVHDPHALSYHFIIAIMPFHVFAQFHVD